ncbi:MAG: LamG-like jellyroll fold domain-containing protein [Bacillota bacterium]|nr:LamG-like jellyroll fold domain-containing protein [Bacillota bacterium]
MIAPTVSLSHNHGDLLMMDGDTVILTATFNENMTDAPQISIDLADGNDADINTTMNGNGTTWTYTWNVPSGHNGKADVTVSGTDITGNPYAGTDKIEFIIDSTAPIAGFQKALSFDGTDDYVSIPDSASLRGLQELSWETWFYLASNDAAKVIWHEIKTEGGSGGVQIWWSNGHVFAQVCGTGSWTGASCLGLALNQWYHIAGVLETVNDGGSNKSQVSLFINGEFQDQTLLNEVYPGTSAQVWNLGRWLDLGGDTGYYFQGKMDEVRI